MAGTTTGADGLVLIAFCLFLSLGGGRSILFRRLGPACFCHQTNGVVHKSVKNYIGA